MGILPCEDILGTIAVAERRVSGAAARRSHHIDVQPRPLDALVRGLEAPNYGRH
jgi:hypothetical protein